MAPQTTENPQVHRSDHVTIFQSVRHGSVSLADPYNWMTNLSSPETQAFIEAENKATIDYLSDAKLETPRERLQKSLLSLWKLPVVRELPKRLPTGDYIVRVAGRGSEHPRSYQISMDTLVDFKTPRHDPAVFHDESSSGGATMASSFSQTGKYWAFLASVDGSDSGVIRFKNVQSGEVLKDELSDAKLPYKPSSVISWMADEGIFYLHCPQDAESKVGIVPSTLRFHPIGAKQEDDEIIYRDPNRSVQTFKAHVSLDGELVFLDIYDKSRAGVVLAASVNGTRKPSDKLNLHFNMEVSRGISAEWDYIGIRPAAEVANLAKGHIFWTSQDNGKVVNYIPETATLETVVPSTPELTMVMARVIRGGHIAVVYSVDVQHQIRVFSPFGELVQTLDHLPFSTIIDLSYDADSASVLVLDNSFCDPPKLWSAQVMFDTRGSRAKILRFRPVNIFPLHHERDVRKSSPQTRQIFYDSADQTKIPMFITAQDTDDISSSAVVLLYVYGGNGISVIPHFRPDFSIFMDGFRGTLAVANVRGGGEYGHKWHAAACGKNRQRVIDDIHGAARHLRVELRASKVVLMGESLGALNSAAALVQKPELFDAVMLNAGPLDVLRRGDMGLGNIGKIELGDVRIPDEFDAMYDWAPIEHLQSGASYPPVFLVSGLRDKLVSAAHSCKFTAALKYTASLSGDGAASQSQYQQGRDGGATRSQSPVHLRIIQDLGHGGNSSTKTKALISMERWLWLCKTLHIEVV
ncbi:hypothetical protein PV08_11694 [Exophiala spinifera]|uniref:Prolyl endopeptidase n=1 Tax=Exophiala spinifera TaxID=91928 RepID=A0A0D2AT74_9EURO|nr:uncharacterized protein PV08_11694 [Exophiala spinifera]KIW09918.1 hypothetical protein PV08_11694 [Exophiala spinifera]